MESRHIYAIHIFFLTVFNEPQLLSGITKINILFLLDVIRISDSQL